MKSILNLIEKIFLKIHSAKLIFEDYYGNKYFELEKKKDHFGQNMRYVLYSKSKNASFIPRFCDEWLRYNIDNETLKNHDVISKSISYLKPHKPNLSGTEYAYLPSSHPISRMKNKTKLKTIYTEWNPN
jgi:NADH:ubiquinone oxidoreductase subunit